MPSSGLSNNLKTVRARLGLSQEALARAAGVTRQTIGGIEAGLYAPSATVAIRLARALGCRVEDLFWLDDELPELEATPAQGFPADQPARLTLARVGERWVAHPLCGEGAFRAEMIPADGLAARGPGRATLRIRPLDDPQLLADTVVLAGCAPALSLWARAAERWHQGLRVHWTHANSVGGLGSLARGEVHGAGLHLDDPGTGESNEAAARRALGGRAAVLVNLGTWEEGLLVTPGNPKGIRCGADLARADVTLINRESGAGSRLLLDALLREDGISPAAVRGFEPLAFSHLAVARGVASGSADAGVSTAAMAAVYGLDFVPLRRVRYDLALFREYLDHDPVRRLLDTLHHRRVRAQLELLGGYDTSRTGEVVAELSG